MLDSKVCGENSFGGNLRKACNQTVQEVGGQSGVGYSVGSGLVSGGLGGSKGKGYLERDGTVGRGSGNGFYGVGHDSVRSQVGSRERGGFDDLNPHCSS